MKRVLCLFWLVCSAAAAAEMPDVAAIIQSATLDASHPYFIPTHPRVTTTVRFPNEIGAPDGSAAVFAEEAGKAGAAEYLVTWQSGDSYFTLTPLREARLANLNVPYRGSTYVLYFYAVENQLKAAASVNFVESSGRPTPAVGSTTAPTTAPTPVPDVPNPIIERLAAQPDRETVAVTPARLLGFLDRLKLLHATAPGPELAGLLTAMNVQLAVSHEEYTSNPDLSAISAANGPIGDFGPALNEAGLYDLALIRVVRDPRLACLGFVCVIRNRSQETLTFDPNSFGVRAGGTYLAQSLSDAPPVLKPGEQASAYFVVRTTRHNPLAVTNQWKVTVDLLSPRVNPGAALTRRYAVEGGP